ncbi:unnamed protein product [Rhizoctonia solani]|uniref:Transmembrane protein n=1 Tax=Rhizoctonia solani TaxID=456999 RepID=A0A8H2XNC0_9AGAM|nr:unnamed protein product [Rhizoctonia solani]
MAKGTITPTRKGTVEQVQEVREGRTFGGFAVQVLWILVCLVTLGFPAKYRERLRLFERLYIIGEDEINQPWLRPATYSDRGDKNNSLKTMRQKQQVSVITATSAAALAIQAANNNSQIYWLVTAFYSIAFGLSLEGLILITYMTISAGGSSDEAITRLARGILISIRYPMVKPAALTMALPAILATYSSISLLLGLVAMVVVGPSEGADTQGKEHTLVTIIPVGVGFLFLCIAIVLCEVGNWIEIWGRRKHKTTYPEAEDDSDKSHCCYCCPKAQEGQLAAPLHDKTSASSSPVGSQSDDMSDETQPKGQSGMPPNNRESTGSTLVGSQFGDMSDGTQPSRGH